MQIEFHLEEPSAEAALTNLVPKILGLDVVCNYHVYNGKRDMLLKLPNRLKAYAFGRLLPDQKIVALLDEDREPCLQLKHQLENSAISASLATKTSTTGQGSFQVLTRIAIEELEAWFFGDVPALVAAFPGVPVSLGQKSNYRNPDSIRGGTWESLERVLQRAGYYPGGLPKVEVAHRVSDHMNPNSNRSKSFQVFRDGLRSM